MLSKLHHVGYRCRDAAETVDFYVQAIGLKFAAALIDHVPSTGLRATNNNVFFEMEDGSYICFFEVLGSEQPLVPVPVPGDWAQHLALEVRDQARAEEITARLQARGVAVEGPVIHDVAGDGIHGELARSWYFRDPNGHRMELIVKPEVAQTVIWNDLEKAAYATLTEWEALKKASLTA
ncbi:VOC family protein [Xanthomonas campestris pv. campestris]|uniref:VOC family protein n=1 Tax=Xanthomonas campestris TaxID=339 RepID=UPI0020C957F9|nr:VOC family protein [Xanthomonas campestris]MDO0791874.1 VOC family protein [Xanthomonas campestris pv. campestris]MDO0838971.1 VOC family protein [Xanthomonas campestris pv. campestris]MEB1349806.1 VOC family protein [Xanthomonas campestris pv. campestris]WDK50785.1 VOC family protein [Xanthomonas campestris pv. campestris]WDK52970.1 VOC family protein [Xanthomonas campestris pv. campestris]